MSCKSEIVSVLGGQGGVEVGEDGHFLRGRVCQVGPVDHLHGPVDHRSEIVSVFLTTPDDIFVCDPEAEYFPLVQRLHGPWR